MDLILTNHAVQRYRERVKPALEIEQCRRELKALAEIAPFQTERPITRAPDFIGLGTEPDGYLELAPGIWAAILEKDGKRFCITCLTNRGISKERRQSRNQTKSGKREKNRRHGKEYIFREGKRRSRKEAWA